MTESELIKKASSGQLTDAELKALAAELPTREDPYEYLLAIGRAGAKQYRGLVESFLNASEDPMLARLALQILCRYWDLSDQYLPQIRRFVDKVDWDEEDDVRLIAISCAGSLLAQRPCKPLLASLLRIFRDPDESQTVREVAYCAMAESTGVPILKLPPASRHFDLDEVDKTVIDTVEMALAKE
jgi:hypothetical protein